MPHCARPAGTERSQPQDPRMEGSARKKIVTRSISKGVCVGNLSWGGGRGWPLLCLGCPASDGATQKNPRLGGVGNGFFFFLASWRNCSMFWTALLPLDGFGSDLGSPLELEEASSVDPHYGPPLHITRQNTQSCSRRREAAAGVGGRSSESERTSAVALAVAFT